VTSTAFARVVGEVGHWLRARVGSIGNLVTDEVAATVWTTAEDVMIRELDGQLSAQGAAGLSAEAIRLRPGRQVDEAIRGQFDVDAIALDDVLARLGLGGGSPPPGVGRVARNAGWWWALRGALVLSDRPAELHRDEHGRAHRADGPAVRYPDGFAVHAWHGLRVPARVIAGDLTGRYWLAEPSAKVRGVIAERIGYPRLLAEVPAIRVHTSERGTLWRVDDPDRDHDISMSFVASEDVWLLELADGDACAPRSVRRVPPDTAGVTAAIAWTERHPDDYRPPTPSY
jgi:hypothetical protein